MAKRKFLKNIYHFLNYTASSISFMLLLLLFTMTTTFYWFYFRPLTNFRDEDGFSVGAKKLLRIFDFRRRARYAPRELERFDFGIVPKGILATRVVGEINCKALIAGEETEITKVLEEGRKIRPTRRPEHFVKLAQNCSDLKKLYVTSPLTEEEKEFPIAYSILIFKDIDQVERLLRAIYRPQNFYCIHVDAKTRVEERQAMVAIAGCFQNVFLSSRSEDVRWGMFSVLKPELNCLEELWVYKKWKYFINLTGQEFPLKTNFELVRILKAYNGANDLEGTIKRANKDRWRGAGKVPHGIRLTKGSVHVVVSRGYVDFVLHNAKAQDFLDWVKKTSVPDETFFSTLNHNPHLKVPGSYLGVPETSKITKPFLARHKIWHDVNSPFLNDCYGKWVRSICVFGVKDLPSLTNRRELFANKFYQDYQPFTLQCLDEWLQNRTREYFFKQIDFNDTYYRQLDFVTNKL